MSRSGVQTICDRKSALPYAQRSSLSSSARGGRPTCACVQLSRDVLWSPLESFGEWYRQWSWLCTGSNSTTGTSPSSSMQGTALLCFEDLRRVFGKALRPLGVAAKHDADGEGLRKPKYQLGRASSAWCCAWHLCSSPRLGSRRSEENRAKYGKMWQNREVGTLLQDFRLVVAAGRECLGLETSGAHD